MSSTFFCWQMRERQRAYDSDKRMWGSVGWLEVWLITRWASLTPPHCLLTVSQRCSLHLWEKKKTKKQVRAAFLHATINKKLISLCWHSFKPRRLNRHTSEFRVHFVLTGASEYWRAQQHLYVKEHILSITADNHRLQGGCTLCTLIAQDWKAQTWHTKTPTTRL